MPQHKTIACTPSYKDGFNIPSDPLYFEGDKKGKITGLKISSARARNVLFTKRYQ